MPYFLITIYFCSLPGREALYEPGRSDGQTKMIREGAGVTCYSWSAANSGWIKIGDVTGAQATPGKTLHNGKVSLVNTFGIFNLTHNLSNQIW